MKHKQISEIHLSRELDWLVEGKIIKILDEGKEEYFKILTVKGDKIIVQQLSKDGVLL